jgi:UDPglucose 6-dehydrogenase
VKNDKVCVVGIWHLGSVMSACLADLGYTVIGVDQDAKKVTDLNKGVPPLFEPGLAELIQSNIASRKLSYTTNLKDAVAGSNYVLITFDISIDADDNIQLSEIFDITRKLCPDLENDTLIIISSQVPIGTSEKIEALIKQNNPSLRFAIAYSPENLRLGQAIQYFKNPDRIIIGANSDFALDKAEALFSIVNAPKLRMNLRSAEMAKHALNCFLATSISFASEIAGLCDELGADAMKVAAALKSDVRIGSRLPLLPGLGFSGGTLARDLMVLKNLGEKTHCETTLINGVLEINQRQMKLVTKKLEKVYGSVRNRTIGVLGLTYKPGTSTLRRSASLEIIQDLVSQGAMVKAYDPMVSPDEVCLHQEFEFYPNSYEVAKGSDALVIITEWPEFKELDFGFIKSLMKKPVLIDTKNILDSEQMIKLGFQYLGVGRGQI